jgi:hypothetical protein
MKKSKINPFAIIVFLIGTISYATTLILTSEISVKNCKKYIIDHASEIYKTEDCFVIDTCIDRSYYTDVSIRINSDSSYSVVFWGNRESFLWNFRKDKSFTVDVPYKRYKGKNIKLDEQILFILKNI